MVISQDNYQVHKIKYIKLFQVAVFQVVDFAVRLL